MHKLPYRMQKRKLELFYFFFFRKKSIRASVFWLNMVTSSLVNFPKPVMCVLINYCSDEYIFVIPAKRQLWLGSDSWFGEHLQMQEILFLMQRRAGTALY